MEGYFSWTRTTGITSLCARMTTTFGTGGVTPYSCRISLTRGRIPMYPALWGQTRSISLCPPVSAIPMAAKDAERSAVRRGIAGRWRLRGRHQAVERGQDHALGTAGTLASAVGRQRVHHPQMAGTAAGRGATQRHSQRLNNTEPPVRIDLTGGVLMAFIGVSVLLRIKPSFRFFGSI